MDGVDIGGLGLLARDPGRFDDDEVELLERLADDVSHALDMLAQNERRRLAEEHLRLAGKVFENSSEGIVITDAASRILMVNEAFTAVTQYAAGEVIGKNPNLLSSGRQDQPFYRAMWQSLNENGEWHGEIYNRRKNGEVYPQWLSISAVKDETGAVVNYVGIFTDLTMHKQIEQRANFLAHHDALTGLPNRALFVDRLAQALALSASAGNRTAVMFLDLDRFNMINETFGHTAGDEVLKEVALRLRDCVRPSDSVARLGGDEFTIVLPALDDPHDAARTARKILDTIARPITLAGHEFFGSASIGIALYPDDGSDVETLLRNADTALYRAMADGGGSYRFYTQDMNSTSLERMSLESKLHQALDRGELTLCYQPLVDARSGRIAGAEALLCWQCIDGCISPATFVPLLEETGLIIPVGEWALATACAHNRQWREAGHPELYVAVNFSVQQFRQPGIHETIQRVVHDAGGDLRFLEVEITERMMMDDTEEAIATLHRLKSIGVKLAIDDFGTGYSSLSYLKRFPLDKLKIDMSFVRDAPANPDAAAIVQAIIAMGHALRLKTVAEGVERKEQAQFLQRHGCDFLQGYYYSKALPHEAFLQFIGQQAATRAGPVTEPV
ncbi:MAG: putative bifunctional diguanylate cyclase/phosphodiesterase [Burkholderiales bacterium]